GIPVAETRRRNEREAEPSVRHGLPPLVRTAAVRRGAEQPPLVVPRRAPRHCMAQRIGSAPSTERTPNNAGWAQRVSLFAAVTPPIRRCRIERAIFGAQESLVL